LHAKPFNELLEASSKKARAGSLTKKGQAAEVKKFASSTPPRATQSPKALFLLDFSFI
jgi:hypothetical protein